MIAMASSVVLLHSLGQDNQNKVQHDLYGHVTTVVQALASHDVNCVISVTIAFLGQNNQIDLQHDSSGYVIPLALASHDINGTVNRTWH